MPTNDGLNHAKCKNPETGKANYWEQNQVRNCSGCPNFLTNKNNYNELLITGINHQYFIDNCSIPILSEKYKSTVRQIENITNQIEANR